MAAYVIAHDVGTSSVKSAIVSDNGDVLAHHSTPYTFSHPQPGWVEQNPDDYWRGVVANTRHIVAESKIDKKDILGIVFSTQAMGIIPVDKRGMVLHPNITWVDGRAEEEALWLMRLLGGKRLFTAIIGIEVTGKDVIPKLRWLKKNKAEIYNDCHHILDVNGFLKYRATGKAVFEWSGACSYAFNLKKKDWERVLFKVAGIDIDKLPPLVKSTDLVGTLTAEAAEELDLPVETAVFGGCDDTQSAAMGSGANGEGEAHIYLGTSAWAAISTAKNRKHKNAAVCLQSADPGSNIIVGITESAGSNFEWLIENFYQKEREVGDDKSIYDLVNRETADIPHGSDHLIFTPWLLGERCPVSTTTTRGTIFNIGLEHGRGHVANAVLEGIGYNLKWILQNFEKDFRFSGDTIRAIGGGSVNDKWMQGIANITGKRVETITRPTLAGSIGTAACAFVGGGVFKSFDDVNQMIKVDKVFEPQEEHQRVFDGLFKSYKELYFELKGVYDRINRKRFSQK